MGDSLHSDSKKIIIVAGFKIIHTFKNYIAKVFTAFLHPGTYALQAKEIK